MSRRLFVLSQENYGHVMAEVSKCPIGTRVELKEPKRTLPQNARLWACLTEVSEQLEHHGQYYTPEIWKRIFLHAFGKESLMIPALSGSELVPFGLSSSDLSKEEMRDFLEFVIAEGTMRGVVFKEPDQDRLDSLGERLK